MPVFDGLDAIELRKAPVHVAVVVVKRRASEGSRRPPCHHRYAAVFATSRLRRHRSIFALSIETRWGGDRWARPRCRRNYHWLLWYARIAWVADLAAQEEGMIGRVGRVWWFPERAALPSSPPRPLRRTTATALLLLRLAGQAE